MRLENWLASEEKKKPGDVKKKGRRGRLKYRGTASYFITDISVSAYKKYVDLGGKMTPFEWEEEQRKKKR